MGGGPAHPYGRIVAGGGSTCNSEPSGGVTARTSTGRASPSPGLVGLLTLAAERRLCGCGRDLCGHAAVDYRRASRRATISPVARGCSAVGSASPCQGEGRGFESRHPLEGAVASTPAVEWPSGEATACKAVHTGSIPVSTSKVSSAISSAGERFPDTEEVTGSIPVSRTSITAVQRMFCTPNPYRMDDMWTIGWAVTYLRTRPLVDYTEFPADSASAMPPSGASVCGYSR